MEQETKKTAIPQVFDGHFSDMPQDAFNTVKITLSAKLDSPLDWTAQKKEAQKVVDKGLNILWDLDLGLFGDLPLPLSDTTQYKSLHLALDHFFETLWSEFEDHTIGCLIFKGSLDLMTKWIWDSEQTLMLRNKFLEWFSDAQAFHNLSGLPCKSLSNVVPDNLIHSEYGQNLLRFFCMEQAVDYFEVLVSQFPSVLLPYVLFNAGHIKSRLHIYQLLDHEGFDFIQIGVKKSPICIPHALSWGCGGYPNGFISDTFLPYQRPAASPALGIVVPSKRICDPKEIAFYETIFDLIESKDSVRYLSERHLAVNWEGLDVLFILEVDEWTKRKLEGFCAAGGEIVYLKDPVGITQEIAFKEYKKKWKV